MDVNVLWDIQGTLFLMYGAQNKIKFLALICLYKLYHVTILLKKDSSLYHVYWIKVGPWSFNAIVWGPLQDKIAVIDIFRKLYHVSYWRKIHTCITLPEYVLMGHVESFNATVWGTVQEKVAVIDIFQTGEYNSSFTKDFIHLPHQLAE